MAAAITSFTPTTGPANGGTIITITGTDLDGIDAGFVGDKQGQIVGTPTSTEVVLRVPAGTVGTAKVVLVDSGGDEIVQSTGDYTYTASVASTLSGTLMREWALEVKSGGSYIPVRGMTNFTPGVDPTTQDDSDFDSDGWGADVMTMRKWSNTGTLSRKADVTSFDPDPGQEVLRAAFDSASTVDVRWYKRRVGWEAYQGIGLVTAFTSAGAGPDGLDTVNFTIAGQGARNDISNPFTG